MKWDTYKEHKKSWTVKGFIEIAKDLIETSRNIIYCSNKIYTRGNKKKVNLHSQENTPRENILFRENSNWNLVY